ncbi:PREDICTED: lysozyme-like, partial [Nicrophorus vespilloides]|uniref:lysozyme n=1 Tax=Nicrophorus vespilloides TaxID=110193 RepID=A0ABM1MMX5_NICVS
IHSFPFFTLTDQLYVHNLDKQCLRCLCYAATSCDITLGCTAGYCGPYKISRLYWIDAGRLVLPEDDPERAGAFEDCALNLGCAQRMVTTYLSKFGKDCNDDNVTDCNDYLKINFNGGYQCTPKLDRNEAGRNWTKRFDVCHQLL